ncbi:MAG: ATP-binding protein [Chloroflexi bacterium GWB2_49_20]|nr:MAG: ATP-binding protein [Chloroflexi bacterium GWB2_49_20]OGN79016.1 MAG: ATP-binding protein [Chloroflexi bacterium GWC2_49_37]OGN86224.1 MAG: ATP-binding protein [Chloroflexi bacterium GWD2_49_16]
MEDFEKLGLFYLGRTYDMENKQTKDDLLLYDSKDLTTHAVCIGMTGSGKTGLCISLIEEAAIDGVPSICIDPKGDLANLCLTFPELNPSDFRPWINLDSARQKGLSPDDYASKQAATWKNGLAEWGQNGERIQRLKDAAEVLIYTPGSNAGIPVSIINSFAAPSQALLADSDLLRDRINTIVSSLLGLVGIKADPVQSREHILLSTIFELAWKKGQALDLANLIQQVQEPPVSRIGVLDLESFYSSRDRFALVMALNNLIASPGFTTWLEGTPLDINQILYTSTGKPRIAIFSIAHLSDPERMFFVSLLMNQILSWMRSQSGTTSLRALVYMDEIFGFLPPVENPPSKLPMLTLLKQARAFGVGMVLATQNPVDLDYKALSNAGTWFIGRLQTEQDKSRLIDGLESATAGATGRFSRQSIDKILSSLENRIFLMNNTHESTPEIFQTRWALSYLRGPLTRDDIKILMDPLKSTTATFNQIKSTSIASSEKADLPSNQQPSLPPNIFDFFIPIRGSGTPDKKPIYLPKLLGIAKINFQNTKSNINTSQTVTYITPITDNAIPVNWEISESIEIPASDLEKMPQINTLFALLPSPASQASSYTTWNRDFTSWLYGAQRLELFTSPSLKISSNPEETEKDFRVRLQQLARERRDEMNDLLRKKYAQKGNTLQERLRKAEQAADKQADQAKRAKYQTAVSIGSTLLGALTGRRISQSTIGRASTAMRSASRTMEESKDVARAGDTVESIKKQIADLQAEFNAEVTNMGDRFDPMTETLETLIIKPRKTDINVQLVSLVWAPYWQDAQGTLSPAW